MEQAQAGIEHGHQHAARVGFRLLVALIERVLADLDVPVGELAPQEIVDLPPGFAVLVAVEQALDAGDQLVQAADDPAGGQIEIGGGRQTRFDARRRDSG